MNRQKIRNNYTSDKQMLALLDILKAHGTIRFDNEFCDAIGLLKQNLVNIRNNRNHFTPEHIERAVRSYKVDANWIFGTGDRLFLDERLNHATDGNRAQTRAQKRTNKQPV